MTEPLTDESRSFYGGGMIKAFDESIAKHDLNQHPFYVAWREGTLPREALARYASEYAPFIAGIASGWETVGEAEHAEAEREHARMWGRFRDAFGPAMPSSCPEAQELARQTQQDFQDTATALGALYAFEAQQPKTAATKLEGLERHYGIKEDAYFRTHASDYGERDLLAAKINRLDEAERARAHAACERTCRAMWSALSGVMPSS